MSYEADETVIVSTLPSDVEVRAYARKLLRRYSEDRPGRYVAFPYHCEGESFDFDGLIQLAPIPWRLGSSADFHTLVVRAGEVATAREACARATTDLESFARDILSIVEGDDNEYGDLREFLQDATALCEPMDADSPARRVAQVFAAVITALRSAAKHRRGIIVVHQVSAHE